MSNTLPNRRVSDKVLDEYQAQRQQRRQNDVKNQLAARDKLIEQQHAELLAKDYALFTARATALIALLTTAVVLYQWLMAPALESL